MILHITSRSSWAEAREAGAYLAPSLVEEGFIHNSTPETVLKVANKWFVGQRNLVLLCMDEARVHAEVKWEGPYGGDYYPHIYGPLNLDAVVRVVDFPPGPDGSFTLPTL